MTATTDGARRRKLERVLAVTGLALVAPLAWAQAEKLAVEPQRSHLRLELGRTGLLKFMGHEHQIEAPIAEGQVEVVESDPARSSVRLRFEAAKLHLVPGSEPADDIPKVEERMRGPEVLDVTKYSEIVFVSTSVKGQPVGPSRFKLAVTGTLTLKGRSFPVEVPLEVTRVDRELEAKGELELNLHDFGIEPPSVAGVVKVKDRFRLGFEIYARP
jgi:polyisoprenoid-binding protein YceI